MLKCKNPQQLEARIKSSLYSYLFQNKIRFIPLKYTDLCILTKEFIIIIEIKVDRCDGKTIGQCLEYRSSAMEKFDLPLEAFKIIMIGKTKSKYFDKVITDAKLNASFFFLDYTNFKKILKIIKVFT